jgi:site-specific DNA-methyltransferase (adenine-specific)
MTPATSYGDTGGASRYFNVLPIEAEDLVPFIYTAKASKKERNAGLPEGTTCTHPTVKPVSVMRHLVRLCCRKGGVVLDPFMGSGTTGIAAVHEGMHFIGMELSEEYVEIAKARIAHAGGNPEVLP